MSFSSAASNWNIEYNTIHNWTNKDQAFGKLCRFKLVNSNLKLLTCLLCKDIVVIIIFHSTECQVCKNVSLLPEANLFLSSRFRKFIVIWVSQFRASLFPPYCRSSRCTARSCLARSSWAASDRRLRATCSWRLWGRSQPLEASEREAGALNEIRLFWAPNI